MKFLFNITSSIKSSLSKDVIYTLSSNLWRIVSGPITLIFIPFFLSPEIQGYWYTFGSIAALSIFADLGFTTIVTQFAAHEYAKLSYNNNTRQFVGDENALNRLSSLYRFVMKWALTVSAIGFPVILLIGIWMFQETSGSVEWTIPWVIYVFVSGVNFTLNVTLAFLEGCNRIADIQKNKLVSAIGGSLVTWMSLSFGFELYALALTSIVTSLLSFALLFTRFNKILKQLLILSRNIIINWRKDFLQLIWKYAISWSSGYFIFQIYTPLTFQFFGPETAGKVGISLSLIMTLFTISNVWIYVSIPKFNIYASKKDWKNMDKLLLSSTLLSLITYISGGIFILAIIYFLKDKVTLIDRFLTTLPLSILIGAWLIQIPTNSIATYLRAHKQEPMVLISIIGAFFIAISTFALVKWGPKDYLFSGFFIAQIIGLFYTIKLLKIKRILWH